MLRKHHIVIPSKQPSQVVHSPFVEDRVWASSKSPHAEEKGADISTHDVIWNDVSKRPSNISDMLQERVSLLPSTDQYRIG